MKILHVVPTYLPARRYGGPIVSVHGLCRSLATRGHRVDVFTTNVDGDGTLDVPIGSEVELDGVRVTYFASQFRRLYYSMDMWRALSRTSDYDLVHIHAVYLWPGAAAGRAARHAKVPYVLSPRGMLVPELIRARNRIVKNAWLKLVERRNLERAAAIHFTSDAEWEDANRTRLPLPSPTVVANGVDLEPRPDVARDDSMLLFLGRLSWKKGIDRAIEAVPPGARLVVAGNDEEGLTPKLRELAAQRNVDVEFPGPVYGAAKDELLARAALFVLLSRSENFGNAVLEALAMETPVVLSPEVGVAPAVLEAGAGTTDVKDVASLLQDRRRREEMGRNGRALVEARFTWDRVAEQMEALYSAVVARRHS